MFRSSRAAGFAAVFAALSIPSCIDAQQRARRPVEISGLPALNFDADEGFGYGVILAAYGYDGSAVSYRWTIQPTVFLTTQGRRDYTLFFDAPARPEHGLPVQPNFAYR